MDVYAPCFKLVRPRDDQTRGNIRPGRKFGGRRLDISSAEWWRTKEMRFSEIKYYIITIRLNASERNGKVASPHGRGDEQYIIVFCCFSAQITFGSRKRPSCFIILSYARPLTVPVQFTVLSKQSYRPSVRASGVGVGDGGLAEENRTAVKCAQARASGQRRRTAITALRRSLDSRNLGRPTRNTLCQHHML